MFASCEVKHADRRTNVSKVQTKVAAPGLDPVWNETLVLHGWVPGEALEIGIYDKGWFGKKEEGKQIHLDFAQFQNGFEGALMIDGLQDAYIQIRIRVLGLQPGVGGAAVAGGVNYVSGGAVTYGAPVAATVTYGAPSVAYGAGG